MQEGQTWIMGGRGEKVRKNDKIHVNSNGMCRVCLGETYNLILDALCEHEGGREGGRGATTRVLVSACV